MAHGRVLAESFFEHHPNGRLTVLLIDDENRTFDGSRESFECVRLSEIGLQPSEIGRLAAIYDVTELATAVKPQLLKHLLAAGAPDVVYLDPDIRLYGSLERVVDLIRQHGIVLTPHTMSAFPRDGRRIEDADILASGMYNLGFIGLSPDAHQFLDWWWMRTRREAHAEPDRMMFTDQRWVDFVPSFFNHFILKDPTCNVAYWNLHSRTLTWTGQSYLVDGQPLTFFHFSGFDFRRPYLLSKHQGARPRILLSESPPLSRICSEYARSLEQAGVARESTLPYGWDEIRPGLPFDRKMRRLYRDGLRASESGKASEPPNPFEDSTVRPFLDWLNEPARAGLQPGLSRYLFAIYEDRKDVQQAFPDVPGRDETSYLAWVRREGAEQERVPAWLRPAAGPDVGAVAIASACPSEGVNVAGYFQVEVGVGEAARHLLSALEAAGIPHSTLSYSETPSRKAHPFVSRGDNKAPFDVNIVCVNAEHTARFARHAGPGFFEGRYTAGFWFWELEDFPPSMHQAFDFVDEVWTATEFVAKGIRAIGRRPVLTIPLPVPVPQCDSNVTRLTLRLPEGFMFLFIFDFFSVLERKNPIGLIKAFERAFRPGEGPILLIKTINGDSNLAALEQIRAAASSRQDILIVDEYYSAVEKNSLLGLCDCYISLHRSEGLGLTMAEAMGLAKPVIATAYSGNLEFMTPDNSYLVNYGSGSVPPGCDPYPTGSVWAEPDLDDAAECMRRVYRSPEEARLKAQRAREDIVTKHNVEMSGRLVDQRLHDIRRMLRTSSTDRQPDAQIPANPTLRADGSRGRLRQLDRLVPLLTPTPGLAPDRRFRPVLLAAQKLLFRILRPYWFQQRAVQATVVEILREITMNEERHQRDAVELLRAKMNELEQRLRDLEEGTSRRADRS
jgi:glycosyltransferase involved in cell wall biosynthesis